MRHKKWSRLLSVLLVAAMILPMCHFAASAGDADENAVVTVHYYNENGWEQPYLYAYWGSDEDSPWPGKAMGYEGDGWYSLTLRGYSKAYVIFSDGGSNQNPAAGETGFEVSGEMWYYKGLLSDEMPETSSLTVHYYNECNWADPYIYYYSDEKQPVAWPGDEMTSEGGGWYCFTIEDMSRAYVMFSDCGSDQEPEAGEEGYAIDSETWFLEGEAYDSEPEGTTVHFYNYDYQESVNIYYYYGDSLGPDWTGIPMTADGDGWYTYKIYGYDTVRVLFNDGGTGQVPGRFEEGFEVSGEMWYRNGEWTDERPSGIMVFFYAPDGWDAPCIYYYQSDDDTGQAWPGEKMTEAEDGWYYFAITKYDSAKVLFNDGGEYSQIPGKNEPGLDAEGAMWYKDGIWCDTESDADGDGLADYMELLSGTDPYAVDTDGDGLDDGYEIYTLGTDPAAADSDGNGVDDGYEDADDDGLKNLDEYSLGTDPADSDSDGDGLKDGEEANTYFTNPLDEDTDGDGMSDYLEVLYGFDPLTYDESFDITVSTEGERTTPAVTLEGVSGETAGSLSVEATTDYVLLSEDIPGYIDTAFEFSADGEFDVATISFTFDETLLEDETFVPRIYYFDEDDQILLEMENQTVEGNTVTATTTHFSVYILLNKTEFDEVWSDDILSPMDDSEMTGMDVVFVIDSSGSMTSNDKSNLRLAAAKAFVEKLGENDRAAVVDFDLSASLYQALTDDFDAVNAAIDRVDSNGGTDLSAGMSMAISQFTDSSYTRTDAYKYIIFLTDGDGSYSSSYTDLAKENGIVVYTIGLGSGVKATLLKQIAEGTGGKYYFASSASDIAGIYDGISVETIDRKTDSNNDGISDYYTQQLINGKLLSGVGTYLFGGVTYEDFQSNDDYDGDGLKNGEEIVIEECFDGRVYVNYISNPCSKDSDGDSLLDDEVCTMVADGERITIAPVDPEPMKYTGKSGIWAEHIAQMRANAKTSYGNDSGLEIEIDEATADALVDLLLAVRTNPLCAYGAIWRNYNVLYKFFSGYLGSSNIFDLYAQATEFAQLMYDVLTGNYGKYNEVQRLANNFADIKEILMTSSGKEDAYTKVGAYLLNFRRDEGGTVYHSVPDTWQKAFGYNALYDDVFSLATDVNCAVDTFDVGDDEYAYWTWRGDYLNLHMGAEVGLYTYAFSEGGTKQYHAVNYTVPMTLSLYEYKGSNNIQAVFNWAPSVNQWWITGFSPEFTNVDTRIMYTISSMNLSSHKDIYDAFQYAVENGVCGSPNGSPISSEYLIFDDTTYTVWLQWPGEAAK